MKYAWALITKPQSTLKDTLRQGQELVETATNVGMMAWQLGTESWEFVTDVADEMPRTTTLPVAQMPPTLRIAMELGAEVISAAVQDALDFYVDQPYEAGRAVGRGMFEVASILAPYAKAGKLANLTKLEFLNVVKGLPFLQGARASAMVRGFLELLPKVAAFCASCYPEGTAVLGERGPIPIEHLKPGDRILA